jgi:YidC/Oxa1 family membrane protein insertase
MSDQKNLLIAIVASILIMVSFQYFWDRPKTEAEQSRQLEAAATTTPERAQPKAPQAAPGQLPVPGRTQAPGATPKAGTKPDSRRPAVPSATPGTQAPQAMPSSGRAAVTPLARPVIQGPRVTLESGHLRGSVALKGGQIDDIVLKSYRQTTDPKSDPIRLLAPIGSAKAYYAEHGWIPGDKSTTVPSADTLWKASSRRLGPETPLRLTWDNGQGLRFTRTIAVDENYMFTVTQRVDNTTGKPLTLYPYGLISRSETPETLGFFILHEGLLGVFDGQLKEVDYDDLQESGKIEQNSKGGWLGITDKYWLVALIPDQKEQLATAFRHTLDGKTDKYQVDYRGAARIVQPNSSLTVTNRLFAGAKEVGLLDDYLEKLQIARFDLAVDFGWFYFLTKPIFYVLEYFYGILGNFGLAILLLTILIKLAFFPLANKSYKAMSRLKQLQPKMTSLNERYGDDKAKKQEAMMRLYKEEKVNPAAGCLPMVIQIPVFFALYKVLFVSIEMRHAPFYGWIKDLSAPDPTTFFNLFGLIPWTPPDFLLIGVWPLIMGLTMWLQQKLNPAPADPMQAKIFMMLPIVFTFMLARFPAGLVIYWAWNNVLSITQQWVIMRRMGVTVSGQTVKTPAAAGMGKTGSNPNTKGTKSNTKGTKSNTKGTKKSKTG